MPQIDSRRPLTTVVNVFTVEPEHQQELLGLLVDATKDVIRHQPGFISANFHSSLDGTRIVNYAQWRSEADFRAMHDHPDCQDHFVRTRAMSRPEMNLYTVEYVESAPEQ